MKKKNVKRTLSSALAIAAVSAAVLTGSMPVAADDSGSKEATEYTQKANAAWYRTLNFDDKSEEENATKGLIEAPSSVVIKNEDGTNAWNVDSFSFLKEGKGQNFPSTINPSLGRNTYYNTYAGLFKVCDGIYQVRGYDMSNATFIQTNNGWIVFDVLMCKEDMAAAKALMEKHIGKKLDVKAVLYSHSHVDHFGGIYGLLDEKTVGKTVADSRLSLKKQLASGKTVVLAPNGFLNAAVSENVYAGQGMGRRAQYQYGTLLPVGEKGKLGIGIGLGQSVGTSGLLAPTYEIKKDSTITIDGLKIQFQLTPGTEAPAEMNAYFPKYRALWMAENCTGTMHNLYTLRGAQVRDALAWSGYILKAEQKFGDKTDVVFQSHNWPHWKTANIRTYMENTAAVYKYINDQTLHYINLGYTSTEIANMLKLPDKLNKVWYTRQYYGTLSHNIKAVYQRYIGWYDSNPVNLNLLPPDESAKKLVEYLGDPNEVLKKAQADYDKGSYQWVAQITKELVYADPTNQAARNLCADALEQLGYQAESGPWRNEYLTGALELRKGNQSNNAVLAKGGADIQLSMTPEMILDYIDIRTDSLKAQNDDLTANITFSDTKEKFYVKRENGILLVYKGKTDKNADCTMTLARKQILGLIAGKNEAAANVKMSGDKTVLERLVKYMAPFTNRFNVIEP